MINSIQKWSIVGLSTLLLLSVAKSATAASFVAQTIGSDNRNNSEFFNLSLDGTENESGLFVKSITFDLAAGGDQDAFFDFSAYAPTLNSNTLDGLTESDITFTSLPGIAVQNSTFNPNEGDTSALKISFASGSFGVGDSFQFGAETDNLGRGSTDDGDDFARSEVEVILELEDGTIETVTFQEVENNNSIAVQSIIHASQPPEPAEEIPEPATVLGLLTVGVLGKFGLKQAKNR